MEELANKGLITKSEGAQVISIAGQKSPLIVVKRDGGFNYASTDLAALWSVVKNRNLQISLLFVSSLPVQRAQILVTCLVFCKQNLIINSSCRGNSIALDFVNSALFFLPLMKVSA